MLKRIVRKLLTFPIISGFISLLIRKLIPEFEKVIFVSSTGRSGTDSLSKLFMHLNNVNAQHEPIPIMHAEEMSEKNKGNCEPLSRLYKKIKSNMIRLEGISGEKIYLESNHMFIKSFIDEAVSDFGNKLTVIYLYRNPVEVAKSIYDLNGVPGSDYGNRWYLDYKAERNIIQISYILDNDNLYQHDFYKCLWYWYEIEARTNFWRNKFNSIRFIDFKTEDLNNREKVIELFRTLNLEFDEEKIENLRIGERHNKKSNVKIKSLDLGDANKMHENFKILLFKNNFLDE